METLNDNIVMIATVLATVAAFPALIEFLFDYYKRKERIGLSLEELPVAGLDVRLAGMDELLSDIADLIDRIKHPDAYSNLKVGNEILLIGPPLSGKKALAKRIAQLANMDRMIIVHNPRNSDALAKAKKILQFERHRKMVLLLPRLDLIDEEEDEELLTELDALIETSSGRDNILVIGTAARFIPGSEVDNLFGITLALPGADVGAPSRPVADETVHRLLEHVAHFYLKAALAQGYVLSDITTEGFVARILLSVQNPSQVEDTVILCQTTALYRARQQPLAHPVITPDILEIALKRVVLSA